MLRGAFYISIFIFATIIIVVTEYSQNIQVAHPAYLAASLAPYHANDSFLGARHYSAAGAPVVVRGAQLPALPSVSAERRGKYAFACPVVIE